MLKDLSRSQGDNNAHELIHWKNDHCHWYNWTLPNRQELTLKRTNQAWTSINILRFFWHGQKSHSVGFSSYGGKCALILWLRNWEDLGNSHFDFELHEVNGDLPSESVHVSFWKFVLYCVYDNVSSEHLSLKFRNCAQIMIKLNGQKHSH